MSIVDSYADTGSTLRDVHLARINAMLVDFSLIKDDIFEFIIGLVSKTPAVRILVSLGEQKATTALLLLAIGVHCFICRKQPTAQHLDALQVISNGGTYIRHVFHAGALSEKWEAFII